jgi:COP9 signalosome complex subunit 4
MNPSDVSAAVAALESPSTTQASKSSGYNQLLTRLLANSPASQISANLVTFLNSLLGDTVGLVASRPVLASFVAHFNSIQDSAVRRVIGEHALSLLASQVVSFEEQDSKIRECLADVYEAENDNCAAAKVLQGIQLESSQRMIPDDAKVKIWIRITRNLLEDDNTTEAEIYLNRAKNLIYKCEDLELKLHFQLSQARIFDARRRFLEACHGYHMLSFSPVIAEEERLQSLSSAITCAVLAPAGPQRSRALARLYKDDRSHQLEADFSILEKMYLDRLLSPAEVDKFAERLSPHQLAKTADGSTVLAKAVVEHNLLGTSRLYNNIGIEELGVLLGLPSEKAEECAARMIEQGRLVGRIDQIDKLIFFDGGEGTGEKTSSGQADRVVGREIRKWDSNVQGLAEEVEKVTTLLQNQFPVSLHCYLPGCHILIIPKEFVTANLVH